MIEKDIREFYRQGIRELSEQIESEKILQWIYNVTKSGWQTDKGGLNGQTTE